MDISEKDILTVNEFAFYIRVHPHTVRKMIKKGFLAFFRAGQGKTSPYRIAKSEALRLTLLNLHEIIDEKAEQKANKSTCSNPIHASKTNELTL